MQKHPASSELNEEVLLRGKKPSVYAVVFEDNDESMVQEAALKTEGGSGPSGLDADRWRKILVSKNYEQFMLIYEERLPMSLKKYAL